MDHVILFEYLPDFICRSVRPQHLTGHFHRSYPGQYAPLGRLSGIRFKVSVQLAFQFILVSFESICMRTYFLRIIGYQVFLRSQEYLDQFLILVRFFCSCESTYVQKGCVLSRILYSSAPCVPDKHQFHLAGQIIWYVWNQPADRKSIPGNRSLPMDWQNSVSPLNTTFSSGR